MARIIPLIFYCLTFSLYGQEVKTVRDIGVWASVGVQYRFNKNWQGTFTQEIRTFDNAVKLKRLISDIGFRYKINDQFKLGAGLRYSHSRKKDYTFTDDIRYNLDFFYLLKLGKKTDLEYRFRFQNNFINLSSYYNEFTRKSHARNQIELQHEQHKHTCYWNAELFREYVIYRRPYFNSLRISHGVKMKTESGIVDYSLGYERELNEAHSLNFFFLKLDYTFKLKHG